MNLNVPAKLHNSFKAVTAFQGKSITDVLMEFVQSYVAKHSPAQTKGRRK